MIVRQGLLSLCKPHLCMYLPQTHLQSAVVTGETSRVKMRLQVQILTHKQETERESTMGMVVS